MVLAIKNRLVQHDVWCFPLANQPQQIMYLKSLPNNLSAIVLAAGQSRRMAPQNKLLLPFRGKPIIQFILDEILPLNFTEILVVIGFEENKIRQILHDYPVRFIFNSDYEKGMSTSIKAGLSQARPNVDGFMIFLGDMPRIDRKVLKNQIKCFYKDPNHSIVVPVVRNRRGNPVIFARKYRNELLGLTGDSGARSVIEKFPERVTEVEIQNERLLMDIDTWQDYENQA